MVSCTALFHAYNFCAEMLTTIMQEPCSKMCCITMQTVMTEILTYTAFLTQAEIDQHVGCQGAATTLGHKKDLKWISAAVHETIRMTCSPIVPHVATQNSTIGGNPELSSKFSCPVWCNSNDVVSNHERDMLSLFLSFVFSDHVAVYC